MGACGNRVGMGVEVEFVEKWWKRCELGKEGGWKDELKGSKFKRATGYWFGLVWTEMQQQLESAKQNPMDKTVFVVDPCAWVWVVCECEAS